MAENQTKPGEHVQVTKVMENARTLRWLIVAAAVVALAWIIKNGIVEIVSEPPWVPIVLVVLTSLIGPTGIITLVVKYRTKAVQKHSKRTAALEKKLDPERTSSSDGPKEQLP
jgi:hypothetical protein